MTVVLAFLFMLVVVAAMSIGVIMGRKPIAGSCGGMKTLGLDAECEVCGGNPQVCERAEGSGLSRIPEARRRAASLASDAAEDAPAEPPGRGDVRTL